MGLFDGLLTTTYNSGKNIQDISSGVGGHSFGYVGNRDRGIISSSNNDYFNLLREITNSNNALSMQIANNQMGFQAYQADMNRKFNSDEAEKTRLWQEHMSNTAHQREVSDLVKAGLNPVLGITNLNGSSTPSGASAQGVSTPSGASAQLDTSLASSLVNLISASMNSATSIRNTKYSADKSFQASRERAVLDSMTSTLNTAFNSISKILPFLGM